MEQFLTPSLVILSLVGAFLLGGVVVYFKKNNQNSPEFRVFVFESAAKFLKIYDASKMSKTEFTQELIAFVIDEINFSDLSEKEKIALLPLVEKLVPPFVDTIYRALEQNAEVI